MNKWFRRFLKTTLFLALITLSFMGGRHIGYVDGYMKATAVMYWWVDGICQGSHRFIHPVTGKLLYWCDDRITIRH